MQAGDPAGDPVDLAQQIWSTVHGAVALELGEMVLTDDPAVTYENLLDLLTAGLTDDARSTPTTWSCRCAPRGCGWRVRPGPAMLGWPSKRLGGWRIGVRAVHRRALPGPSPTEPDATLEWNQRSLTLADEVRRRGRGLVAGFYPSLQLNVGHSYEQLGDLRGRLGYQAAQRASTSWTRRWDRGGGTPRRCETPYAGVGAGLSGPIARTRRPCPWSSAPSRCARCCGRR